MIRTDNDTLALADPWHRLRKTHREVPVHHCGFIGGVNIGGTIGPFHWFIITAEKLKSTSKVNSKKITPLDLRLPCLVQHMWIDYFVQRDQAIKMRINLRFSTGNITADSLIPKVQKETTTKEWKSAICLRNYHLICIIGGLGCSSVPGGCVFIARLFAVINFSSAPDFLKGGRGRLPLNNEWHAFILSLKCPWCYNMKRQR